METLSETTDSAVASAALRFELGPAGVEALDRVLGLLERAAARGELGRVRGDRRIGRGRFATATWLLGGEDGGLHALPLALLRPREAAARALRRAAAGGGRDFVSSASALAGAPLPTGGSRRTRWRCRCRRGRARWS